MRKSMPMFYSALLLTAVNLLLRFAGTSFQVYLSGRIGAEGIGLLQLVLSVGALALTVGMGGIRTATMYLTAEELGKKRSKNVTWVLSACFLYSIAFSGGSYAWDMDTLILDSVTEADIHLLQHLPVLIMFHPDCSDMHCRWKE